MARFAQAEINLSAIRHNYLLAKQLANGARTLATVKANAYGHGAVMVASVLADVADAFSVACIEEAIELRESGIKQPIVLLEGFFSQQELALIDQFALWPVVHHDAQIAQLAEYSFKQPLQVWLKMDSGMHRLGFLPHQYKAAYQRLAQLPQVSRIVHTTHFASADDCNSAVTEQQVALFKQTIKGLAGDCSHANSAAIMRGLVKQNDWARPGIMLYGSSPNAQFSSSTQLQTSMRLCAKVIAQRTIQAGEGVGYNHIFKAERTMRVGTVSMGYADGYPRAAGNQSVSYFNKTYCAILGRVSMDMLSIDLSRFSDLTLPDEPVELWGPHVSVDQVAKAAGTISYELFCGLNRRVKRSYINNPLTESVKRDN